MASMTTALLNPEAAAAGLLDLNPPTIIPNLPIPLDPSQVSYSRQHVWGDKLLRKLTPDQVQQYLAEVPFVSSVFGTMSEQHESNAKRSIQSKLGHRSTIRQKLRVLVTKAIRSQPKNHEEGSFNTTDVSDGTYQRGKNWVVPGVGEFANKTVYTFTGTTLPTGLTASNNDEQKGSAPYAFRFDATNVTVSGGTLNLKVPGGQDGRVKPISCAEVTTDETTILHASVRVTAKLSAQAGVCQSAFFYRNDQVESDIEYLTDPASKSNQSNPNATLFWYSNQAASVGGQPTHQAGSSPPTVNDYHVYRLDWTSDFTAYYLDGKLQSKLTDNVPNKSGMWVFNNWSNGDPGWSCGPPSSDSIFSIRDITMYYNTLNNPSGSS